MDKERLEQYRAILKEIEDLRQQIRKIEQKPPYGTDVVKGSDDEYPYCQKSFSVSGVDYDKLDRLTRSKEKRLSRLIKEQLAVEEWFETVTDSVIRQIIQMRYLDGRSWRKTATEVYGRPYENLPRMAIKRFFEKN